MLTLLVPKTNARIISDVHLQFKKKLAMLIRTLKTIQFLLTHWIVWIEV